MIPPIRNSSGKQEALDADQAPLHPVYSNGMYNGTVSMHILSVVGLISSYGYTQHIGDASVLTLLFTLTLIITLPMFIYLTYTGYRYSEKFRDRLKGSKKYREQFP